MTTPHKLTSAKQRSILFAASVALCLGVYLRPVLELLRLSLSQDTYSHILLVPFVSIGLALMRPRRLREQPAPSPAAAAGVFLAGVLIFGLSWGLNWRLGSQLPAGSTLALTILSLIFFVWAAFLLFYGIRAFHSLLFPLFFLLLAVPLPQMFVDQCITWLQNGSAAVTYGLFHLTGTPVFRSGNIFVLPDFSIEIAKECSGIRSAVAMLITCLLAGYLFLRSGWSRIALLVAALPMLVIKNGIRIVTLSLLAMHVDPGFLNGRLHHEGGFLFFLIGLLILWPVLIWLQHIEAKHPPRGSRPDSTPGGGSRAGPAPALPNS